MALLTLLLRPARPSMKRCALAARLPTQPRPRWQHYDAEQLRLMEERCILLDRNDTAVGDASKKECHLMANIHPPRSLLHRAFSCFLFRPTDGKLLLQKRADEKITFPKMWTNTCRLACW
jgi:hypothetical protein